MVENKSQDARESSELNKNNTDKCSTPVECGLTSDAINQAVREGKSICTYAINCQKKVYRGNLSS